MCARLYALISWATVCKTVRPMLSDRCLSPCPVLLVLYITLAYCDQMVGWIKTKLGVEVGLGLDDIVLDEDPTPLPKGAHPQLSAHVCCGQTA